MEGAAVGADFHRGWQHRMPFGVQAESVRDSLDVIAERHQRGDVGAAENRDLVHGRAHSVHAHAFTPPIH